MNGAPAPSRHLPNDGPVTILHSWQFYEWNLYRWLMNENLCGFSVGIFNALAVDHLYTSWLMLIGP